MELQQLLSETAQRKASDLHLKSGSKPILRIHGHLEVQDDLPMVTREFIDKMAESLLGERRVSMLLEGREMDLGYMLPGIGRFRCNLFLAMGEVRGVFRHVPERIPAFQELHLPKVLERLSMERRGMILVTGHLVLSTLHTLNAAETINRMISMFPPHQEDQIRGQLAAVIQGIVSQRLVVRADGRGRVPAVEIMIATGLIRDCIREADKTP